MALFDAFLSQATLESDISSRSLWRDDYHETEVADQRDISAYATASVTERHKIAERLLSSELKYLNEDDICSYCRRGYKRVENLGHHRCRYHPSQSTASQFPCCGISTFDTMNIHFRGCRPCDHLPTKPEAIRWTDKNVFYRVPAILRHRIGFPESSIVKYYEDPDVKGKSFFIVTRVEGHRMN